MKYFDCVKKSFKLKNFITYFVLIFATLLFSTIWMAGGLSRGNIVLLENITISILLAASLSLVVGFLGELSLGHAGFMCIGAYLGGFFQTTVFPGLTAAAPLVSIILAMLIGGIIAAAFGFIIGLPALRLKGDYLAIVTLAFGEIIKTIFLNAEPFGATLGMDTYRYDNSLFIIGFVVVLIAVIAIQNLIRSKHGRAIMAIRDNEIAARAMGVNVTFYKIAVFVFSAFFAGVAGVLYANANTHIASSTFDYNYSINILVMVVLGGMGNMNGSIISATIITILNTKLATIFTGNLAALKNLIYALILIALVIYNNAPALKNFRDKYNFKKLFEFIKNKIVLLIKKQHPVPDPAEDREHNADWSKIPTKIEMDAILSTDILPDSTYTPDVAESDNGGKSTGGKGGNDNE